MQYSLEGLTGIRCRTLSLFMIVCTSISAFGYQPKPVKSDGATKHAAASGDTTDKLAKPEKTAYDYTLPGADGKDVALSSFKGKYILVVNLARKSSYNDQLVALIKTSEAFKDKGLVVVGVPSNDFGAGEPGIEAEIQKAYVDAKVPFPVMAVSKLEGNEELPFYHFLTKSKDAPPGGSVHWNYTKFVVDKNGKVIARLSPDVAPDSAEMLSTLTQILDGSYKQKKEAENSGAASLGDDDDDD
jgi:glutathione peroxidase